MKFSTLLISHTSSQHGALGALLLLPSVLLMLTLASCNSSRPGSDDEQIPASRPALKTEPHKAEIFWDQFKKAAQEDNREEIARLSEFPMQTGPVTLGGGIGSGEKITREAFFSQYYTTYFLHPQWKAELQKKTFADFQLIQAGYKLEMILSSTDAKSGEIYSSGWTLYFRELSSGDYRLAGMSFAG